MKYHTLFFRKLVNMSQNVSTAVLLFSGVVLQFVGCATVYWTEEKPGTGNRCIDIKTYHATEEYFSAEQLLFKPGRSFGKVRHNSRIESWLGYF